MALENEKQRQKPFLPCHNSTATHIRSPAHTKASVSAYLQPPPGPYAAVTRDKAFSLLSPAEPL